MRLVNVNMCRIWCRLTGAASILTRCITDKEIDTNIIIRLDSVLRGGFIKYMLYGAD